MEATKAKNRSAAAVQITTEQLIRESRERQTKGIGSLPLANIEHISNESELIDYRARKRKNLEDQLRRHKESLGIWVRYAKWEESQGDFEATRSVFERALDVDYRSPMLWMQYAEMEQRNKFLNHARNIWERAIKLLPMINQFWYKYVYMEESIGNVEGTRNIFKRWMKYEPEIPAWNSYINFELRNDEIDNCRNIYKEFINVYPELEIYLKYASFEEKQKEYDNARDIYEMILNNLSDDEKTEKFFIEFAHFEERRKDYDRAKTIYKFALNKKSKELLPNLYSEYITFEKKYGDKKDLENAILKRRRDVYESKININSYDYDTWFDYIRLEENENSNDINRIRDIYERAIFNVPLIKEKKYWRRYIYLWINYALYEELIVNDIDKTREIYQTCLNDLIPHKIFTFSKLWIMYAYFEIRQHNINDARKILGQGIGLTKKEKIFKEYIKIELQLGEIDRCRILYNKYIQEYPYNADVWIKFAEFENKIGEIDRTRSIYNLAINQDTIDTPELVWKSFIDFEINQNEGNNVRNLFELLLQKTQHVKVWNSYAKFEVQNKKLGLGINKSREIFQNGYNELKNQNLNEERMMLLEAWKAMENEYGTIDDVKKIEEKMPKRIKKTREIINENNEVEIEEYYTYLFPDDNEKLTKHLKFLEMAHKWKKGENINKRQKLNDNENNNDNNIDK